MGRVQLKNVLCLTLASACLSSPLPAQEQRPLSRDIGNIERGFWTRSVSNELTIDGADLLISQSYRTRVEWESEGVPGRHVTDTLEWRIPLEALHRAEVQDAPGSLLLEGSDQDSYCPLTIVRFSCATAHGDCSADPEFVVCRYNRPELMHLLEELQKSAQNMEISVHE